MGRSPVRDKGSREVVAAVDSMVVGLGMLTAAFREEFLFADSVIVKKSVIASAGCLVCPSAPSKTISSSIRKMLSQTDAYEIIKTNRNGEDTLSPAFQQGCPFARTFAHREIL
jgi:hypothetical protein